MSTIGMTPGEIRVTGNRILSNADSFSDNVKSIYTLVEGMLQDQEWAGLAASDFEQEFNQERVKFQNFGKELQRYGQFLVNEANKYEQADNELKSHIHQSRG